LFWGPTLKKVPHGAWLPLGIGVLLTVAMCIWHWAKERENEFDFKNRVRLAELLRPMNSPSEPSTPPITYLGGISEKGDYLSIRRLDSPQSPLLNGVPLTISPPRGIHFCDSENSEDNSRAETPSRRDEPNPSPQLNVLSPNSLDRGSSMRRRRPMMNSQIFYKMMKPLVLSIEPGPFQLPRMLSVALFQRQNSGIGAPHSFVSFLKHCPALPRVIIFMETRQSILAHVPYTDRYFVRKITNFPGFYSATLRLGYRDALDLTQSTDAILSRICVIERQLNDDSQAEERVQEIVSASRIRTHFLPQLYVHAKPSIYGGRYTRPVFSWCVGSYLRKYIAELLHFFLKRLVGLLMKEL